MEESQLRTGNRRRVRVRGLGGSFSGSVARWGVCAGGGEWEKGNGKIGKKTTKSASF